MFETYCPKNFLEDDVILAEKKFLQQKNVPEDDVIMDDVAALQKNTKLFPYFLGNSIQRSEKQGTKKV